MDDNLFENLFFSVVDTTLDMCLNSSHCFAMLEKDVGMWTGGKMMF
jgi:hypothetical protein